MVRPARFGFNPQTAASNAFQHPEFALPGQALSPQAAQEAALREFDRLAEQLVRIGIEVFVGEDTAFPVKPDAVFPNNWVSFHADGKVVLYPMLAANRRLERRQELIRDFAHRGGFYIADSIDLSYRESESKFLEGTGSLVLDRCSRLAYANLSPRTDLDVLGEFAQQLDYDLVTFEARDGSSRPIYHTNVLMAVGSRFAVLCDAAIPEAGHRSAVADTLRGTGHEIVRISIEQMRSFGGNVLELAARGGPVIAMSTTAWQAFEPSQRRVLESHGSVLAVDIPGIERLGGGGVRCMLAEIHLPRRPSPGRSP
ncbi:MAG: arginine deiminase-related protein [Steroidobacteraceae bacterium]